MTAGLSAFCLLSAAVLPTTTLPQDGAVPREEMITNLKSLIALNEGKGSFDGVVKLENATWKGPNIVKEPLIDFTAKFTKTTYNFTGKGVEIMGQKMDSATLSWDGNTSSISVVKAGQTFPINNTPATTMKEAWGMLGPIPAITRILIPALFLGPQSEVDSFDLSDGASVVEDEDKKTLHFGMKGEDKIEWRVWVRYKKETGQILDMSAQTTTPKRIRHTVTLSYAGEG